MLMIVVALPLFAIAVLCWIFAGRVDLKRKIKSWSGERSTLGEAENARKQILALRMIAIACVVVAIVGAVAINLFSAYIAYGVR